MKKLTAYLRSREPIDTILDASVLFVVLLFASLHLQQPTVRVQQPPRSEQQRSVQLAFVSAPHYEPLQEESIIPVPEQAPAITADSSVHLPQNNQENGTLEPRAVAESVSPRARIVQASAIQANNNSSSAHRIHGHAVQHLSKTAEVLMRHIKFR